MTPDEINKKYGYGKYKNMKIEEEKPLVPHCPTCNSTDITKISDISKVMGAATFGLFSKTARSQFKCNNCGYKW